MDFEEFLQWFYSHFQKEKPPARSLHCSGPSLPVRVAGVLGACHAKSEGPRMVDSVTEHFYASMGVNRLRCYVTALEPDGCLACNCL